MGKLATNILKTAKKGDKLNDGGGLYLYSQGIDDTGTPRGSWIYRYRLHGKASDYSLGTVDILSLAKARSIHNDLVMMVKRDGICPKAKREQERAEAQNSRGAETFKEIAEAAFEATKGSLKNEGSIKRWFGPVEIHLIPTLGHRSIESITQHDLVATLKGLWHAQYPTAKKALSRLSVIFRYAVAHGLEVDMNAITSAKVLLGASTHTVKHHPALPPEDVARLYQALDEKKPVERALMVYLLIGGGARLAPLRKAHIDDINAKVWTFPKEAMKGVKGKSEALLVPVTDEMQKLLELSASDCTGGFLFSTKRGGSAAQGQHVTVVSDQSIENIMRDKEREWSWKDAYRPHGIRSSYRSWAEETHPTLYAAAEASLGHRVGSAIERTYQRSELLDQRRDLLNAWQNHLMGLQSDSVVVPFLARGP